MGLKEIISNGVEQVVNNSLNEQRLKTVGCTFKYERAKEYVRAFESAEFRTVQESLGIGNYRKQLANMARKARDAIHANAEVRTELNVIIIPNNPCEILMPAYYTFGVLEDDIIRLVSRAAESTTGAEDLAYGFATKGSALASIRAPHGATPSQLENAVKRAGAVREMELAGITIAPVIMPLPITGYYPRQASLTVSPSWLGKGLISLTKKSRAIFPEYKEEFFFVGNCFEPFSAAVTSENSGVEAPVGKYICSRGTGELKRALQLLKLSISDRIKILESSPQKRYILRKL